MGEANVILGIKILRDDDCITLSQSHYVQKVLKKFEHFDMPPMSTPYDSNVHLVKNMVIVFHKKNMHKSLVA